MQHAIEELIRGLGWAALKLLTAGRYQSRGTHAELAEGTIGLLLIAAMLWLGYQFWPA